MEEAFIPGVVGNEFIQESTKVVTSKDLDVWSNKKEVMIMIIATMALKSNTVVNSKLDGVMDTVFRFGATRRMMASGTQTLFMDEANLLGTAPVQAILVTFEVVGTMEWEATSTLPVESTLASGTRAGKMEQVFNAGQTVLFIAVSFRVERGMDMAAWSIRMGARTKEVGRRGVAADSGSMFHRRVASSIAACGKIISQQTYLHSL